MLEPPNDILRLEKGTSEQSQEAELANHRDHILGSGKHGKAAAHLCRKLFHHWLLELCDLEKRVLSISM